LCNSRRSSTTIGSISPAPARQNARSSAGLSISFPLEYDFDEARAGGTNGRFELALKVANVGGARRFDSHAVGEFHPIELGIVQIEHGERLWSGISGADAREFDVQNSVGAI